MINKIKTASRSLDLKFGESSDKDVVNLIKEIQDEFKDKYIFRGTNRVFSVKQKNNEVVDDHNGISSGLYRWAKTKGYIHNDDFDPLIFEKRILFCAHRDKIFPSAKDFEIETNLQHIIASTNYIDFSYNIYVALFFACHEEKIDETKDGELILFKTQEIKELPNKEHPLEPYQVVKATITKVSGPRASSQRSVFVYSANGYISHGSYEKKKIPKGLKTRILTWLKKHKDIDIYKLQLKDVEDSTFYCYLGIKKLVLGHCKDSLIDFDKAIELDSKNAYAYYYRGNVQGLSGYSDKAIKDYDKAIKINPQLAAAYSNRGYIKEYLEQYEEAIKDYDKAIKVNPQFAEAFSNRGISKAKLKMHEEAAKDFNRAITIDPNYAIAYYKRGINKQQLNDIDGARTDFYEAKRLGCNLPIPLDCS